MNILTFPVPKEATSVDFNKIVSNSDSMETPPALFRAIEKHFSDEANEGFYVPFNLDVCCDTDGRNSCVSQHYLGSGLNNNWSSRNWQSLDPYLAPRIKGRVWCNPPYSEPYKWVEKAYHEVKVRRNAELAVLLLRLDPSTKLWNEYASKADEIYILTGRRVRFIGRWYKNGELTKNTASNHPHMLMVFRMVRPSLATGE